MMTPEHVDRLLLMDESETLERKQSFDEDGIRKTIIAFANDLYGRGVGYLVLGQAPDKKIVGLSLGEDELQRRVTDIARDKCCPAIPVSVESVSREGKTLAIVVVRASAARPHFSGKAWIRMGSTTRLATDAEIILLKAVEENKKVAVVKRWLDEGRTTVIFWQLPAPGEPFTRSPNVMKVTLLEVNENWVVLDFGGRKRAFPFDEFNVGYDPQDDLPQIRYHGRSV